MQVLSYSRKIFLKYIFQCLFSSIIHVIFLRSLYFVNIELPTLALIFTNFSLNNLVFVHISFCTFFSFLTPMFHTVFFLPLPCFQFCMHLLMILLFSFFIPFSELCQLMFHLLQSSQPPFSECYFFVSCSFSGNNCSITFFFFNLRQNMCLEFSSALR